MKFAFILTTYDRIDDFLTHLDILKYYPEECEVIPIWMNKEVPKYFLKEMKKYKHAHYCDGVKFSVGPLLGLISGLKKAKELNCEYVIYRNGDDWLFNHDFVKSNLEKMNNKIAAGYNWLSYQSKVEFAMNELILRVDSFIKSVDVATQYFLKSRDKLCELKIANWIRATMLDFRYFYRLPDREIYPGIGYTLETLPIVLRCINQTMNDEYYEKLKINHRFFNKKWQLLGQHDNLQRYADYQIIRNDISYYKSLEKEPHFARWLDSCENRKDWNLPSARKQRFHGLTPNKQSNIPKLLPKVHCPGMKRSK